jgi:UDP-N-acetylglucosamine:LPS N-acetylglucosamine transferase
MVGSVYCWVRNTSNVMALPVVHSILHSALTGAEESDLPSERFRAMPQSSYVPDLIHAADAVLGKLGYGFVSECVTSGTALIYVPRVDWPEEPYLEVTILHERLCCPQYGFSEILILCV